MALKDSFISLNKALRTTLQNVPAVVDTLVRGFDEIGDAAEELSTYSTDERVIGKWIDGSVIYAKTIDCGALPANGESTSTNHNISNIGLIVGIEGAGVAEGYTIPLPSPSPYSVSFRASSTEISIRSGVGGLTGYNGYVTIKYTKSTSNRAPENDTKNVIDEEPVAKTVDEPAEDLKK